MLVKILNHLGSCTYFSILWFQGLSSSKQFANRIEAVEDLQMNFIGR